MYYLIPFMLVKYLFFRIYNKRRLIKNYEFIYWQEFTANQDKKVLWDHPVQKDPVDFLVNQDFQYQ